MLLNSEGIIKLSQTTITDESTQSGFENWGSLSQVRMHPAVCACVWAPARAGKENTHTTTDSFSSPFVYI